MLDVDMDEAEVVVLECPLALGWAFRSWFGPAAQTLGLQDAPNAVAIEVRQEVRDDEGEVIEREVGGSTQGADNGPFLFAGLPGQSMGSCRAVQTVCGTALAPLAHGLGADAVASRQDTTGLAGAGDLGANGGCRAGLRMDLQHGSPRSRCRGGQALEPTSVIYDGAPHRIPTMFRDLTPNRMRKKGLSNPTSI